MSVESPSYLSDSCEHSETDPSARILAVSSILQRLGALCIPASEIPESGTCFACSSATRRSLVTYEYVVNVDATRQATVSKVLPGYRCGECKEEYQESVVSHRFLSVVADGLAESGDRALKRCLDGCDVRSYTALSAVPPGVMELLEATKPIRQTR